MPVTYPLTCDVFRAVCRTSLRQRNIMAELPEKPIAVYDLRVIHQLVLPTPPLVPDAPGNLSFAGDTAFLGQANGSSVPLLGSQSLVAGPNITLTPLPANKLQISSTGGGGLLPAVDQIVYVQRGGNDVTGNGSISAPYATITHAMATITDALWEKRYMIDLGPGNWSDSFSWKAWVFLRGSTAGATRLTGVIDINDPSWGVPGSHSDERAGAQDVAFTGTLTLNFTLQTSNFGKFFFWNCNMNNTLVITAQNPINQVIIQEGLWFGGITTDGGQLVLNGVSGQSGNITLNSSTTALTFSTYGGAQNGNLSLNYTLGPGITAILFDTPINGNVSVSGAAAALSATNSSLPIQANISIAGGGSLTRLTDAFSLAYTPAVPAQWAGNPTSLQNAIDRMAALLFTLSGAPIP